MKRILMLVFALAACDGPGAALPAPVTMTEEALGHFCMMRILDHGGPKAQIHLEGYPNPIFFSQVRDAIAYSHFQEREAPIIAFYVNDMEKAKSWDEPGRSNWLNAEDAHFVVGADVKGGMGAPELVPFGSIESAQNFITEKGGLVLRLDEIPSEAVLGAIDLPTGEAMVQ